MITDDIDDLKKGVDHNADITAALAIQVTANPVHIRDNADITAALAVEITANTMHIEENTCAIDELKTNGEENLNF